MLLKYDLTCCCGNKFDGPDGAKMCGSCEEKEEKKKYQEFRQQFINRFDAIDLEKIIKFLYYLETQKSEREVIY